MIAQIAFWLNVVFCAICAVGIVTNDKAEQRVRNLFNVAVYGGTAYALWTVLP